MDFSYFAVSFYCMKIGILNNFANRMPVGILLFVSFPLFTFSHTLQHRESIVILQKKVFEIVVDFENFSKPFFDLKRPPF